MTDTTIAACIALAGCIFILGWCFYIDRLERRAKRNRPRYPSAVNRKLTTPFDEKVIRMYVKESGELQELDEHEGRIGG